MHGSVQNSKAHWSSRNSYKQSSLELENFWVMTEVGSDDIGKSQSLLLNYYNTG
jgi:hypothetical protein